MKIEVSFRSYELPRIDEDTGEQERGDFLGSFKRIIEGKDIKEVIDNASGLAGELSKEWMEDVRVFEIPLMAKPPFGLSSCRYNRNS